MPRFPFMSLFWATSFSHSFKVSLPVANYFHFPSSENILIFFSFQKVIFIQLLILDDSSFISALKKCAASFIVSGEKYAVISVVFSQRSLFKIFSFILSFQKFDLIYLGVDILGFTQFRVWSIILICRFMCFFLKNWGWRIAIISLRAFSFLLLISSPYGTLITQMLDFFFHYSLTVVWASGYFLSVVQIGKFLLFYIQLYWSLFPPFCYWAIHWVFIVWLLYISVLKFPLGLLRLSIYFLRDFCLFVSSICNWC